MGPMQANIKSIAMCSSRKIVILEDISYVRHDRTAGARPESCPDDTSNS